MVDSNVVGLLAAASTTDGRTVSGIVGMSVCVLLLLQWAFWQILDPRAQKSRAERKEEKEIAARRKLFEPDRPYRRNEDCFGASPDDELGGR